LTIIQDRRYFLLSLRRENDQCEFRGLPFTSPIDVSIGVMTQEEIPISDESPVITGPLALFNLPVSTADTKKLLRGFELSAVDFEIKRFANDCRSAADPRAEGFAKHNENPFRN
jgi:hypothetical protein